MSRSGIFVGMVTLDLVYLSVTVPGKNQKIAAQSYTIAAGGPATNAAVTYSYLGNQTKLLGILGTHPITQLIREDLEKHGVQLVDINPTTNHPPPISSIIVTQSTGDRAVITTDAQKSDIDLNQLSIEFNSGVDLVMIDGHQITSGYALAQLANHKHIPVVIDGGSWKPGFEKILPYVDYAICSANFYPPGCHSSAAVIAYLSAVGIPYIAITQGEKPIIYSNQGILGELPVPQINPVDTMGAGDVFHGAFCHYILQQDFTEALSAAAKIASHSCQFFGTRQWMLP